MGAQDNLLQQYQFAKVPLHYNPADFIKAAVLTFALMTTVSLLPALWAARRKPSEAMRDVA
jgi:ABC-type lipoprotein release transport system permease subunit